MSLVNAKHIVGEIEDFKVNIDIIEKANKKFNGNIINEKYGLAGKDLGDSIIKFKNAINIQYNINNNIDYAVIINTLDLNDIFKKFEKINNL